VHGFEFEPEITVKVARMKCRINDVRISYFGKNIPKRAII
jgi:hypothetical protein